MSRAALIGGGVIGGGWAARFVLNGWDVALYDPDPEAPRKLQETLDRARFALPMLYETALPPEGSLRFADSIEDCVAGAEICIESAPERLEIKQAIYGQVQTANPGILIGSSTSGFKPSELGDGAKNPDHILVTHPFNPVYLLPLIEVVGGSESAQETVTKTLQMLGFFPLRVRHEIDAHIADRFLEAVWREALWLVKDGIATTEEIDDAIRFGFGLRWAQMGLFETYRLAGGEAGMAHFIAQFGPALKWPWTKLMDVPDLTDALIQTIADQSDAQSGHSSIANLATQRDKNLVAMMRALKQQGNAAGQVIAEHEKNLIALPEFSDKPVETVRRVIPTDWTDYNGHMNESRYGQVFSDAADAIMAMVGVDADYIAAGHSYFTVETQTRFLAESHAGDDIHVATQTLVADGKKLRLFHRMMRGDTVCATCTQMLIHVSLETRRSCPPATAQVQDALARLGALHALLPDPE